MANKKKFYYVLVLTEDGPVFVTSVNFYMKEACWKKDEAPYSIGSEGVASDLSLGLTLNGNYALCIASPFEITKQPFRYDLGKFSWVMNEDTEEE